MASEKRGGSRLPLFLPLLPVLLLLSSCSPGVKGDFPSALRGLDAALGAGGPTALASAFEAAASRARDSADWLSLAKRALPAEARGDRGRTLRLADEALRALPSSESVAAAAAWLYLRGGRAEKALALFPRPLDPEERLGLWAETRLSLIPGRPLLDPAECGRLGRATGRPSGYYRAALLSLRAGDRFAAQAWLRKAVEGGYRPPTEVLWDAALPEELLSLLPPSAPAAELSLGADAAWLLGRRERAAQLWGAAESLEPSWRREAALAILSPSGPARLAAARSLVASYPEEAEALRFAALLLEAEGEAEEAGALAPRLLSSGSLLPEALGLELDAGRQGEARFVARAGRLPEEHPAEPGARTFALRVLFAHGRWHEYLQLYDQASTGDRRDPGWWFWSLGAALLRGDLEAAAKAAEEGSSPRLAPGPEGAFAQGLVAELRGDPALARRRFEAALALSTKGSQKAAALKELGRLEGAAGRRAAALAAFAAARAADPSDAEAAILAAGGAVAPPTK